MEGEDPHHTQTFGSDTTTTTTTTVVPNATAAAAAVDMLHFLCGGEQDTNGVTLVTNVMNVSCFLNP